MQNNSLTMELKWTTNLRSVAVLSRWFLDRKLVCLSKKICLSVG